MNPVENPATDPNWIDTVLPYIQVFSLPGIIFLGLYFIMTGKLQAEKMVNGRLDDKNRIIDKQQEYIITLKENNALLRRGNEAAVHVVDAIPEVAGVEPS